MQCTAFRRITALFVLLLAAAGALGDDDKLLTVAESSEYRATATHAQVMDLIARIGEQTDVMHITELGRTVDDKPIPLVILANPPIRTAAEARESGKGIVFAFGNIHAGEVCGKEALLMLMRELALNPEHHVLDQLIVAIAPIYNADGNDRMSPDNRPGQVGPIDGMGERPNSQGLDLNRDYIKLESPEARAMVRFLTEWDPHLTIDTHTTNGSYHRYTLTYESPLNPSGPAAPIAFVRNELLPIATERLLQRTGYDTCYYGNLSRDATTWATYSAEPRFGGPYCGLRGQMAVLSEAYSYASYRDRVLCTREFVSELLRFTAENRQTMIEIHEQAKRDTIAAGQNPQPTDMVGIRHRHAAYPAPLVIKGYEMERGERGRPRPTEVERDYSVVHLGRFEPTLSVRRPYAYIIRRDQEAVVEKLKQHGVVVEPFTGRATIEKYTITEVNRQQRPFQKHRLVSLEAEAAVTVEEFPPGTMIARTAQPLGTLLVYLLEPESQDGLAAWNFFDDVVAEGATFPVFRVRGPSDIER